MSKKSFLDKDGLKHLIGKVAKKVHTHTKDQITDFPTSMPASDVPAWAKAASKPTYTAAEVGAAAANHGHSYNDLSDKPTIPSAYTHPAYTARTGKPTGNQTPAFGSTFTVSQITSDATGHVTGATDRTVTIPSTAASQTAAGLMSAADKTKLDGIATGANKTTVDTALSSTSTNPVQNKVINTALAGKADSSHTHTVYYDSSISRTANTVLAAPNGSAGGATFRKLAVADLPTGTSSSTVALGNHTHNYAGSSSAGGVANAAAATTGITTAGTGAAYTATVSGITALTAGVSFIMVPNTVSTSTTPTLNVNSFGAKGIRRRLSNLSTSAQAGYSASWLAQGKPYLVVYDGSYWIVEGMSKPAVADLYGTSNFSKIETGSYTGTGTHTVTLNFSFAPKLVIVRPNAKVASGTSPGSSYCASQTFILIRGANYTSMVGPSTSTSYSCDVTWSDTSVKWVGANSYQSGSDHYVFMNGTDWTYLWVAIG